MPPHLFGPGPRRLMLVASTGGHLAQLLRFAEAQHAAEDSIWVTFDSPQSRSMLAGKNVLWVDYVAPRDWRGVYRAYRDMRRRVRRDEVDGVLSTGAAVAVSAFFWARKHRVPAVYVESVSRTNGPSLTGRITRALRLADTYTQHPRWADSRWTPVPSVMRGFEKTTAKPESAPETPRRILVTLGTIRPYRFDRLVDQVLSIIGPADDVVWQLGETSRTDLPGTVHELLEADELLAEALRADVVVTHAGVGTILQLLENGVSPVVVPRRREFGEHIDEHQMQIWQLLVDAGIAVPRLTETVTREALREAATTATRMKATA